MAGIISKLRVFDRNDLQRIHDGTVNVLKNIGIQFQHEEALEIFKHHGAKVEGQTVFIPERLLEKALETAPKSFEWYARDPEKSVRIGRRQRRTHVALNNGPVYIQDREGGRRPGTLEDLINLYKLGQHSEVCSIVGQIPVEPGDLKAQGRHLHILYHLLRHSDKPLFGFVGTQPEIREMFDMLEIASGNPMLLKEHAAIGVSLNPLSPLKYDHIPCETLLAYAKHRQPVMALTCAMSGVTAPVRLMGTVVLQNSEILAGLVLTQLIKRGTPFIYSPGSAVPNMRTAAYITGSPESNLINIAGVQLVDELYDLPCRAMAGLTDAKTVDCQAGFETMQNLFMLLSSGVHLVNECLGVLDSIMTVSYEKFIIDEEMLSRLLVVLQGMDTSESALSLDVIQEVGHSGSYLMHPSTLQHCREAWSPSVSHWGSYSQWEKEGAEDIVASAGRRWKEVLAGCPDTLLDEETDKDLRRYIETKTNPVSFRKAG